VEGTLIHDLLTNPPDSIKCLDGKVKPRKCQIECVSFTAHVDYFQNSRFIRTVAPDNVVLVHGEKKGMRKLKEELGSRRLLLSIPFNVIVSCTAL
jgi:cleavage and polyadenylation specificity factor subunit 3